MIPDSFPARERGTSLLEVLITLVVLAIGLLGLAGLQSRLQASEMESYQRAQALVLANDMASRIAANRSNAGNYVTGADSPLGVGGNCPNGGEQVDDDLREWCEALQGASETSGGNSVGAMVGGRGCVEDLGAGSYRVTVAWQGLVPVSAPTVTCGQNLYDGQAGSKCVGDLCRRVLITVVRIGDLT